ncbi:MAG: hypothetical protein U1F50_03425 [Rubrivivax sp.]
MVKLPALQEMARRAWRRALRRFGPFGLAGLSLMSLAALVAAFGPRLDRGTEDLRQALEARRVAAAAPKAASAPEEALGDQERLERFVGTFPPLAQNAQDMAAVFDSAERAHVVLAKADYAVRSEAGSPFIAYTATFPLREPYGAIKAFTANVLRALPHAALEEMRMGRPDVGGTVLEASVRFTLVYRRP